MAYKMIHVGAGGWGTYWCRLWLPQNIEEGLIEVVAVADIDPEALRNNAQEPLGMRDDQCYTDVQKAFDENQADFCTVVVPPAHHEQVVDVALAHDMHVLSEKPIADTLEASVRIANKVKKAGKKMGVTMSHRFDQDKTTLRQELLSGRNGEVDYVVGHHTCSLRKSPSWGEYRHKLPDVQLVEGCVHHLDILADFAGAKCDTIYAETWNPPWGEYEGDPQALVIMRFENGARGVLEAAEANSVGLYPWLQEYWRVECERSTLVLSHRNLERFAYEPSKSSAIQAVKEGEGETIPLIEQPKWHNIWLIEKFVKWLDGGEPMETNVEDNLQSVAMVFSAVESSRTGQPVKVQESLARARKECEE